MPDRAAMTSSKPYLVRALYEWILDNGATPYILVNTTAPQLRIPPGICSDGKVVLNISPQAVEDLDITNDYLSFSARFNGVAEDVYCPIGSLMAIYARENGEGMMFPAEADDSGEQASDQGKQEGPTLKVIK